MHYWDFDTFKNFKSYYFVKTFYSQKGTSVLGSGKTCDLRLQGEGVNPIHCSLTHDYGHPGVTLK